MKNRPKHLKIILVQQMFFESIPADLVLKIFNYLPFRDRVRLRGVNRLFDEISQRSISCMRSLNINDDLVTYSLMSQPFPSLLESCSPMLESIKVINRSYSKCMVSALADFVYPKLERLEITVTNNALTKKLISRNQNLRTVNLHLDREFEWPEDIVMEKLENLEISSSKERNGDSYLNLCPTLRPLIGMVPNLKRLKIKRESNSAPLILSVQELNQLLATTPRLEHLTLRLYRSQDNMVSAQFINMCSDLVAALPTWHLSKLTRFFIDLNCPIPPSILQHFSTSSPKLITVVLGIVTEVDDQSLMALSKLKQLRQLCLPDLEMSKDKFSKMTTFLPSITHLQFKKIDDEALTALARLQHLRELRLCGMEMIKAEIIDVITNVPSFLYLRIKSISDARSHEAFTDFVTSTGALFHRNLKIRLTSMRVNGNESELDQMRAVLEDIEKNGGPVVEMDDRNVLKIRYRALA